MHNNYLYFSPIFQESKIKLLYFYWIISNWKENVFSLCSGINTLELLNVTMGNKLPAKESTGNEKSVCPACSSELHFPTAVARRHFMSPLCKKYKVKSQLRAWYK